MLPPTVVTVSAREGVPNEDAVATGPGVVVVVDGAGLPADLRRGCAHTVSWYAAHLAETFRDHLADVDRDLRSCLAEALRDVAASHGPGCQLDLGSPSATVAAWRIGDDIVDGLVLGDASLILVSSVSSEPRDDLNPADSRGVDDSTTGVIEVTDDRLARVTEPLIEQHLNAMRAQGREPTGDDVRQARRAAVEQTRNRPDGFWCCHADPAAAYASFVTTRPRGDLAAILAATDGATRGYQLLGAHGVTALAQMATQGRAEDVIAEIRAAESTSTVLSSQGMKTHDDATLVTQRLTDDERD